MKYTATRTDQGYLHVWREMPHGIGLAFTIGPLVDYQDPDAAHQLTVNPDEIARELGIPIDPDHTT